MSRADERLLGSLTIRRTDLPSAFAGRLAAIDLRQLFAAARREGLDCLLYANLARAGLLNHLPDDLVAEAATRYRQTAARNMLRGRDLAELSDRLEAIGIRIVALKGMALLDGFYPDPGLRPTGDADVWVDRDDLPGLTATLEAGGYTREPFYPDVFRRASTTFDIHTHLLGAERVRAREMILAAGHPPMLAETLPSGYGAATRKLGKPQEILLLMLHFMKHNADRLLWLIEINELVVDCSDHDWQRFLRLGQEMGQTATIGRVAFLAELLWPSAASPRLRALADTARVGRFSSAILRRRARAGALPAWGPLVFYSPQRGAWGRSVSAFETLFPRPPIIRQIFRDTHTSLWRLYVRRFGQLVASLMP